MRQQNTLARTRIRQLTRLPPLVPKRELGDRKNRCAALVLVKTPDDQLERCNTPEAGTLVAELLDDDSRRHRTEPRVDDDEGELAEELTVLIPPLGTRDAFGTVMRLRKSPSLIGPLLTVDTPPEGDAVVELIGGARLSAFTSPDEAALAVS
jgi:hypothetical protein